MRTLRILAIVVMAVMLLPVANVMAMDSHQSIGYSAGDAMTWSVENHGDSGVDVYLMDEAQYDAWSDSGSTTSLHHEALSADSNTDGDWSSDSYSGTLYLLVVSQDPSSIDVSIDMNVEGGSFDVPWVPIGIGAIVVVAIVAFLMMRRNK